MEQVTTAHIIGSNNMKTNQIEMEITLWLMETQWAMVISHFFVIEPKKSRYPDVYFVSIWFL